MEVFGRGAEEVSMALRITGRPNYYQTRYHHVNVFILGHGYMNIKMLQKYFILHVTMVCLQHVFNKLKRSSRFLLHIHLNFNV